VAAAAGRVADPRILAGPLTGGQLTAHLLLSAAGHSQAAAPSGPMPAVHLFAVLVGAGLISAAERLCRLLYTRLRAPVVAPPWTVPTGGRSPLRRPEQPLRSRLLLAVSISHRGPPVAVC
jgi:hypothetical protein